MEGFISVTEENRVDGISMTENESFNINIDVPEDHEIWNNPFIFTYSNGELVKDEEYQQVLIDRQEKRRNQPSVREEIEATKKQLATALMSSAGKDKELEKIKNQNANVMMILAKNNIK